jgi:hypothetical protein
LKPLYTEEEFNKVRDNDKLPLECIVCNETFYQEKRVIKRSLGLVLSTNKVYSSNYCSKQCCGDNHKTGEDVECANCFKIFYKQKYQMKQSKSGKHFCTQSCAASYNNKHKSHGNRRSRIEILFEENLIKDYKNLTFIFNNKEIIDSELDIYIVELNLAIEMNGILHKKPIYGEDKLLKILNNDKLKINECENKNIELFIVDYSHEKDNSDKIFDKYYNILKNKIDSNIKSLSII